MRVFVIGATGCAGLNVARRLADDGQDVVGLARNEADAAAEVGNGILQANQHVIRRQQRTRSQPYDNASSAGVSTALLGFLGLTAASCGCCGEERFP